MPLFLDTHTGRSRSAQRRDASTRPRVRIQGPHGFSYLRYGVDEARIKVFCLADAPSADGAADVHREAHGLGARERYQFTEGGH